MSYESDLAAVNQHEVAATLVIDGIPILFGNRSGIVYPTVGGGITNPPAGGLTSIDAFVKGSLSIEGSKLDYDMLMVPPSSAALTLRQEAVGENFDRFFKRRLEPEAFLSGNLTETATSFGVNRTDGYVTGEPAYINRETMLVDSLGPTTMTVTRNYMALTINSRGGAHHAPGSVISPTPQFFIGRWAELRMYLGPDQSVVLANLYISASPKFNEDNNTWELSFNSAMRYFDRPVATGFKGSPGRLLGGVDPSDVNATTFAVLADNDREFQTSEDEGHIAAWDEEGRVAVEPIIDRVGNIPHIRGSLTFSVIDLERIREFRRCYLFKGSPMKMLLEILLSDRGLGAGVGTNNASYDVLFGITSSSPGTGVRRLEIGEVEARMGAAIPSAMVDINSMLPFTRRNVPGFAYLLGARGDESLLDIIEEVAWAHSGIFLFDNSGRLTFRELKSQPVGTLGSTFITPSDWGRETPRVSVDDETEIVHTVELKCNYDHVEGRFWGEAHAIYEQERETHREIEGTAKLERKSLYVSIPGQLLLETFRGSPFAAPIPLDQVRVMLDRIFTRRIRGLRKYVFRLPWKFSRLQPGDRVNVTSDSHIDFEGNTLNQTVLEVTAVSIVPLATGGENPVEVEMQDTFASRRISPTARILSFSSGPPYTLNLDSSSQWEPSAFGTPGLWFAAGWKVKVLDQSASPPFSVQEDAVIDAVGNNFVELTGALGVITPAAGDLLVQDDYDDADNASLNPNQGLNQRQHTFQADDMYRLGTANDSPHKWG